jgi:hypothetical protein
MTTVAPTIGVGGYTPDFGGGGIIGQTGTSSGGTALTFTSSPQVLHELGGLGGGTTTIAAGTGAGTGPTVSLSGNDVNGQITITTGTSPAASAIICTVTLSAAFGSAPFVIFSPANANAALLSGASMIFVTSNTTTFSLNSGTSGLTATTTYLLNYHLGG